MRCPCGEAQNPTVKKASAPIRQRQALAVFLRRRREVRGWCCTVLRAYRDFAVCAGHWPFCLRWSLPVGAFDSILGLLTSSVPSAYVAFLTACSATVFSGTILAGCTWRLLRYDYCGGCVCPSAAINSVKRLGASAMALPALSYSLCRQRYPGYRSSYGYPTPLMLGGFVVFFCFCPVGAAFARFTRSRQCARAYPRRQCPSAAVALLP